MSKEVSLASVAKILPLPHCIPPRAQHGGGGFLHAHYQGEGLAGFTRLSRGTWVGRVARTAKPGDSVQLLRPGEASAPEGTAWHWQLQPITCALSYPCSKLQKVPEPAPPRGIGDSRASPYLSRPFGPGETSPIPQEAFGYLIQ